jgi:vacuolar-type H+-ATPase subunit F/Vma7
MENIINDIINNKYELYNFTTILNKNEKDYLVYLVNDKNIMKEINESLDNMELNNISKIILVISNMCIKNNKYNLNIINIIKILIEIIIYMKFDKSNNEELKNIYNTVEICLKLLELNPNKYNFCIIFNWCK